MRIRKLYTIIGGTFIALLFLASDGAIAQQPDNLLTLSSIYGASIIEKGDPGTEYNNFGFEGGIVFDHGGLYHLFSTEYMEIGGWDHFCFGHWTSPDQVNWTRSDTAGNIASGDMTGADPKSAIFAPMPFYDDASGYWNMYYVGYYCSPEDGWHDGSIFRAVSETSGPNGLNGPWEDVEIALEPDASSQWWEGPIGVDSMSPPYQVADGTWRAFYGSALRSQYGDYNQAVGLAKADAPTGPWTRCSSGNPTPFGSLVENPIVTKLSNGSYMAVFDGLGVNGDINYAWSPDGLNWSEAKTLDVGTSWWGGGQKRTPMSTITNGDGSYTIYFAAKVDCGGEIWQELEYVKVNIDWQGDRYWRGSGIWDDGFLQNWGTNSGGPYNAAKWSNACNASFEGTAGIVSVSGTIDCVNSITFTTDGYTLTGGVINMTGVGGKITTGAGTDTIGSRITGSAGLTKLGSGTLRLTGWNTYTGTTNVAAGTLELTGQTNVLAYDTTGPWDVTGTVKVVGDYVQSLPNSVTLRGGSLSGTGSGHVSYGHYTTYYGSTTTIAHIGDATSIIDAAGGITLQENQLLIFDVADGVSDVDMLVSADISPQDSSTSGVTKTGLGTLWLTGSNTYTGATTINAGALRLNGTISNTSAIHLASDAVFDVSGVGNYVLGAEQTLSGCGTILGDVTVNGTLAPGNPVNTMTFGDDLTLAGITIMEIAKNGLLSNDSIDVETGVLTFGGTLTITEFGEVDYALGDSWNLFDAGSLSGSFSSIILPTLEANLVWDTTQLMIDGTLDVIYYELIPGDADRNGIVDESDASILAANWLKTDNVDFRCGDFNDDGKVNDIDATILAANWGYTTTIFVPEAASSTLLCIMLLTLQLIQRIRKLVICPNRTGGGIEI